MSTIDLPREAARYFVDLGWTSAEAELWLADTVSLAGFCRGGTSAAAASQSGASAPESMIQSVYRELETLERQARAKVLAGVTARLARSAASLGSAGLELVAPSGCDSRGALVAAMEWEARRSKSERLLGELRSPERPRSLGEVSGQGGSPGAIALALGRLGRRLSEDDMAWGAMVEVALAFGEEAAARDLLLEQLDLLTPADEGETREEAALRERCMRLLSLAHLLLGEDSQALALTEAIPLVLDRSASMGTLRATLEFRMSKGKEADATNSDAREGRRAHDEFVAPVGPVERRYVARFLVLAHRTSNGALGERSGGQELGVSR